MTTGLFDLSGKVAVVTGAGANGNYSIGSQVFNFFCMGQIGHVTKNLCSVFMSFFDHLGRVTKGCDK